MAFDPHKVQAIFLAACECKDLTQRDQFVLQQSGDDLELKARVDALLKAHDDPSEFQILDVTRLRQICDDVVDCLPDTVLAGRYRLLERIADGGMGTVWRAQQIAPVQRQVALKLIKSGLDSRRLLARFELERQSLALMTHPNIAQVFDGGVTEDNRPFFVMELVAGLPITKYCDHQRLTIENRLRLFLHVCHGVHHAHQKGIIHRDLKPSNVLVCRYEDLVMPKVIDFGLAKAISDANSDNPAGVPSVGFVGTPRYMSPEQADLENLDIDTRSDVYSLGVILYELICGTTPLSSDQLKDAVPGEMLALVKASQPLRPSQRIAAGLPASGASSRATDPTTLQRTVRGDLDWIAMKALAKDRAGRYQSANELAQDIERYLRNEAIAARPATTAYRLSKLARRYRAAFVAAALVLTALIAGTVVSSLLAIRATKAEHQAQAALAHEAVLHHLAEEQRAEAEAARAAEVMQREIAQAERDEAEQRRARAERAFDQATHSIDAYFVELTEIKHLNVPALQPLRKELLSAALAYYRKYIDQHSDDPELRAELASAYARLGELTREIGSKSDAIEALKRATQSFDQLAREPSVQGVNWFEVGFAFDRLGMMQQGAGDFDNAEKSYQRALELRQRVAKEEPDDTYAHILVAEAHNRLGNLYRDLGRYDESEACFKSSLQIHLALAATAPNEATNNHIGDVHYYLGALHRMRGQLAEAEASFLSADELYQRLIKLDPTSIIYSSGAAGVTYQLGHVRRMLGQFDLAKDHYAEALAMYTRLAERDPSNGFFRRAIGGARFQLGLLQSVERRSDEAESLWQAALSDYRSAIELGQESIGLYTIHAETLAMLGRWQEAVDVLSQSFSIGNLGLRPRCHSALLHWAAGNDAQAAAACEHLLTMLETSQDPAQITAVATVFIIASHELDAGGKLMAELRQAATSEPSDAADRVLLGTALFRSGQLDEARSILEQALPLLDDVELKPSLQSDVQFASRLLGHTVLMLAYQATEASDSAARERHAIEQLIPKLRAIAPVYCDEAESWRVAFAILFAERQLAAPDLALDR